MEAGEKDERSGYRKHDESDDIVVERSRAPAENEVADDGQDGAHCDDLKP